MGYAQVVISVLLLQRITRSTFAEKADFDREDEIDIPFYRSKSISITNKGDAGLISKGDFQFALQHILHF